MQNCSVRRHNFLSNGIVSWVGGGGGGSVVDLHHIVRIRIQGPLTSMRSVHFDADLDPDPIFYEDFGSSLK